MGFYHITAIFKMTESLGRELKLTQAEVNILLALAYHMNEKDGKCCPSTATLMRECVAGRTTLFRAIARLEGLGVIRSEKLAGLKHYRRGKVWLECAEQDSTKLEQDSTKLEQDSTKLEQDSTKLKQDSTKLKQDSTKLEHRTIKNIKKNIKEESVEGNRSRFTPPTLEEVKSYAEENGCSLDADRFCDFYESKGWMVGRNKMKDWRAAVRNWARGDSGQSMKDWRGDDFACRASRGPTTNTVHFANESKTPATFGEMPEELMRGMGDGD